jgi:hypothetical protein
MKYVLLLILFLNSYEFHGQNDSIDNVIYKVIKQSVFEEGLYANEPDIYLQCKVNNINRISTQKLSTIGFKDNINFYKFRVSYDVPVKCYDPSSKDSELIKEINNPSWRVFAYNHDTKNIYRISGFLYSDFMRLILDENLKYNYNRLRRRKFLRQIHIEDINLDLLVCVTLYKCLNCKYLNKSNINSLNKQNNTTLFDFYDYDSEKR